MLVNIIFDRLLIEYIDVCLRMIACANREAIKCVWFMARGSNFYSFTLCNMQI